jgi:large repetitive protein
LFLSIKSLFNLFFYYLYQSKILFMKKIFTLILLLFTFSSFSQLILTADVNSGCPALNVNLQITNYHPDAFYVVWDYADGPSELNQSDVASHTYNNEGVYTVYATVYDQFLVVLEVASTIITVENLAISDGGFTDPTTCGGTDGTITIAGTGTGDLSWTGTNPGNIVGYNLGDPILNLSAGTYDFTFTQGACVSNTVSITLTDPAGAVIADGGFTDPTTCGGTDGTITIAGAGTGDLFWTVTNPGNIVGYNLGDPILNLSAGTYDFTFTQGACVSNAVSITLTDPAGAVIADGGFTDPTTCGGTDGTITIAGAGTGDLSWTGTNPGNIVGYNLGDPILNLSAGTYDFTFTQGACVSNTVSITLTDPAGAVIADGGFTDPTTCGGTDGEITIAGAGTGDLSWTGTNPGNIVGYNLGDPILNLSAGTYDFTFTQGACVSNTVSITLTDPAGAVIADGGFTDPTTCGGTDGTITIAGAGIGDLSWTGTNPGNIVGYNLGDPILNLSAGTYDFTFTQGACVSNTVSITLTDPAGAVIADGGFTDPTTCGGTDGIITIAGAGTGDLSWTGTNPGNIVGYNLGDPILNLSAGTYDFTFTQGACVSNTVSITLTDPAGAVIADGGFTDPTTCGGTDGEITIAGAGTGDLSWTGTNPGNIVGYNLGDPILNLSAGTYDFTFTQGACVSNTVSITLTDPAGAVIADGGFTDPTTCGGTDGTITIAGAGTGDLSWTGTNPGNIVGYNLGDPILNLSAGTYDFTFTQGACVSNAVSITLTDPAGAVIADGGFTDPTTCGGTDGTITIAGTGTGDLSWTGTNPGNIVGYNLGDPILNLSAGTYDFTFTQGACVSNAVSITLTDPAGAVIADGGFTDPTTCGGTDGTITIAGSGTGDLSWTGTNPGNIVGYNLGDPILNLSAGTYDFTFTQGACVSNTVSITLTDPAGAVIADGGFTDPTTCGGTDGTITIAGAGTGDLSWTGTNPGNNVGYNLGDPILNLSAGTYDFTFTQGACVSNAVSITLTDPAGAVIADGGFTDPTTCGGTDGTITIAGAGTGDLSWTGTNPGNIVGYNLGDPILNLSAGTYDFTFTQGACVSNALTITLTDPTIVISEGSVFGPSSCGLTDANIEIMSPSFIIGDLMWTGTSVGMEAGFSLNSTTVSTFGAGTYDFTFTDGFCTSNTISVIVNEASVSASMTSASIGQQIDFFTTGDASSVTWDFGDGIGISTDMNPSYTYSNLGSYTVTATIVSPSCGTFNQTILITIADYSFATTPLSGCAPLNVDFNYTGSLVGVEYLYWDFGDGNDDFALNTSISNEYLSAGTYICNLYAYDIDFNFLGTSSQTIIVGGSSVSSSMTSASIGQQIDFFTTGDASSVTWDFGDGIGTSTDMNPSYTYSNLGSYTVTATIVSPSCGTFNQTILITIADYSFATTPLSGCAPLNVDFNYTGSLAGVEYLYWDFGDGNDDFALNTSISNEYLSAGTYICNLYAYDIDFNFLGTSSQTIIVGGSSVSSSMTSASIGQQIDFFTTGDASSVTWDFGDGIGTSTDMNPSYTYSNLGSYTVTATIVSPSCGTFNQTILITIADYSFATTPLSGCAPLNVDFNYTGSLVGVEYLYWDFGDGNDDFALNTSISNEYLSAGTYICNLYAYDIDFNFLGTSSQTIIVSNNPTTPTITANGPLTFCDGGSVTLTSSSATNNVWSTGETTQDIIVTNTGVYSVFVSDAGCNSLTSSDVSVTINPIQTISLGVTQDPSVCGNNDGTIEVLGFGLRDVEYFNGTSTQIDFGVNLPHTIVGLVAGTYDITLSNGCSSNMISTTISDPGAPATPTITASGATTFCDGDFVILSSSSATDNIWSTGETTQDITVTVGGNYSLLLSVAGCNSTSVFETVTVNPIPATPTISSSDADNIICDGEIITLTSSSATDNIWSTGETTQSIDVNSSQVVNVTVNTNGCTSVSNDETITVNPLPSIPTISASGNTTFCEGNFVTLTSSSPIDNVWSTGETTQSIDVLTSEIINVSVISNGCSSISSDEIITVNSLPIVSAGSDITACENETIILSGTGAETYVWDLGVTDNVPFIPSFGLGGMTFTVVGTDINGCQNTDDVIVFINAIPATPSITAGGSTTFCDGDFVTLTSSSAIDNVWSTGETSQSIDVSTAQTVFLSLFVNGCYSETVSEIITVNVAPSVPTISLSSSNIICDGETVTLTSSSPTDNLWSTGETTQSIDVSSSGTYNVTVSNGLCSKTSLNEIITVTPFPATPTITASGSTTFCDGETVTLTSSSPTDNFWSTGETSESIVISTDQTVSLSIITNGCSSNSVEEIITVNPIPGTPSITSNNGTTICSGSTLILSSSALTGNIWSTGASSQNINVTSSGTYILQLEEQGCLSNTASISINVIPSPNQPLIFVEGSTSFCEGGSVVLTSSVPANILWSTGETNQSIVVNSTQDVSVSVSTLGCSSTSEIVSIIENLNPVVNIQSYDDICNTAAPFSYFNGVPSGGFYDLNGSPSTLFEPAFAILGENAIEYTFIDANGCSGSANTTITVYDCVELNEESLESFVIFPNPTNGNVIVKGNLNNNLQSIEVRDELGRIVFVQTDVFVETTLNLSNLADGMYSLILKGNNFEKIERIQLIK